MIMEQDSNADLNCALHNERKMLNEKFFIQRLAGLNTERKILYSAFNLYALRAQL